MDKNRKNTVDDTVKEALKNLEASYNPQHWQMMEQRLRDLDQAETTFDAHIKDNVERLQKSYQSKHWEMMSQRLDEEFSWKSKIVRYKVVEVALMLLLLITGINYYENDFRLPSKKNNTPQSKDIKSFRDVEDWRGRSIENENNKPIEATSKPTANLNLKSTPKKAIGFNNTIIAYNALNNSALNTNNSFNINKQIAPEEAVSTEGGAKTSSENAKLAILDALPILKNENLFAINTDLPNLYFKNDKSNKTTVGVVEPISTLRSKGLTINHLLAAGKASEMSQKKSKLWLSMFGIGSFDKLNTSYVDRGRDNKRETSSYNIGQGLNVGYRLGKWDFQSGVAVSSKSFEPNIRVVGGSVTKGFYEEKINKLEFDIASIPLNVNYHFIDNSKWRIFSYIGASFNAILYSKENREIVGTITKSSSGLRSNSSDYVLNNYEQGLFEKQLLRTDAITNIHYFTANFGVGTEYKITPVLTLYTQAGINKHIGRPSIGTLNDRINSMSAQFGLRVNVGKYSF
jgi:hypothetical protein